MSKIICAFPGTGKSYFSEKVKTPFKVLDSDSSKFNKKHFPHNYIESIKTNIDNYDVIFASTHKIVRDCLKINSIIFMLVYPQKRLKSEYMDRFKNRGDTKEFIELINKNWENWIDQLEKESVARHFLLEKDEYISSLGLDDGEF